MTMTGDDASMAVATGQGTGVGDPEATLAVQAAARAARGAAGSLAVAPEEAIGFALRAMAGRLDRGAAAIRAANEEDMRAAGADGLTGALMDRLRLDGDRLKAMAGQLHALAGVPPEPGSRVIRELPGGLVAEERRRPVGVIGANFEARPNVVADIASQLIKSRNAGVLRTGSAALRSAIALTDEVIAPALSDAGLDPGAIQLVRMPGQASAYALVSEPELIPLVILRGSGASTRALAFEGARHGVRTLAHADGGAVVYVDSSADRARALGLIEASLDRLGVCNRLNLLLVDAPLWDSLVPEVTAVLERLGVTASLPPHEHALGHEWALDTGHEATVTVARAAGAAEAAALANDETSGLAAAIVAEDHDAVAAFLDGYAGTGAFWNASPRLLDGFKLLAVPETGINIDKVPGPRGPVTFRDLYLRQFVVGPRAAGSLRLPWSTPCSRRSARNCWSRSRPRPPVRSPRSRSRPGSGASTRPIWSPRPPPSTNCAWPPARSSAARCACCSPGPGWNRRRRRPPPGIAPAATPTRATPGWPTWAAGSAAT
jgi:glutamate-5-semialdehyde dehydrogenase